MPYAFIDSTFGVQDEAVSTFIFLLPLLIYVVRRFKTAAIVDTVGIWTKFFNGVIFLVLIIKAPTRRDAWKIFGITALITAAVAVPFLIIAPDKFLSFPSYYLLQDPTAQTGGLSMWHFWDRGGYTLPGTVGVIMTLVAVLGASYYVYRTKDSTTFWEGCFIVMMAFFIFYPMIHLAYYLMPVGLLLMWGATNRKVLAKCFLSYVPLFLAACLAENVTGQPAYFIPRLLVRRFPAGPGGEHIPARHVHQGEEGTRVLREGRAGGRSCKQIIINHKIHFQSGMHLELHEGLMDEFSGYERSPIDDHQEETPVEDLDFVEFFVEGNRFPRVRQNHFTSRSWTGW